MHTIAKYAVPLIAALLGAYIILLFCKHSGVGLSPDSIAYLSTARNVQAGKGLIYYSGGPLIEFPVFYPLFLRFLMWFLHHDVLWFAPALNATMFAGYILLCTCIMRLFKKQSLVYELFLLTCIVMSPCLLEVYSMLWSETLFLVFTLFFILALHSCLIAYSGRRLLILTIITAIACITRYAGVFLVCTGGLLMLLDRKTNIKQKAIRLFIFGAGSCSLLAMNLWRNKNASATLTGMRQKAVLYFHDNLYYFGQTLVEWLPLNKNNYYVAFLTAAFLCAILLAATIKIAFTKRSGYSIESIIIVYSCVYAYFILVSATLSRYELINSRILSPLFVPMLWSLTSFIPEKIGKVGGWVKGLCVLTASLVWLAIQKNQYAADYETWDGVKEAGVPGYTEKPWEQSVIANYLKNNKDLFKTGAKIYSNAGDAVYFFTGKNAILLPQRAFPNMANGYYAQHGDYLVWFYDIDDPDVLSIEQIQQHKPMVLLKSFDDGLIYADSVLVK